MAPSLPVCCLPQSFRSLAGLLPCLDSPDALLSGAVAVAVHQMGDAADLAKVDARLQAYADTVRRRVRGHQPQALLAHLHDLLFEHEGFTGNISDYYNPANSYLPAVLDSKRGLPITLCLVYKSVGERLGLRIHGVALPGHFLASVEVNGAPMLVDPFFGGREISPEEAQARMIQILGPEAEWSDELLRPTSNRQWLTRLVQNLLNTFASANQYVEVAAMLELEMLLWPSESRLQRDLALVLARCGLAQPAWEWLDRYLKNNPNDPQKQDLKQLLDVLAV